MASRHGDCWKTMSASFCKLRSAGRRRWAGHLHHESRRMAISIRFRTTRPERAYCERDWEDDMGAPFTASWASGNRRPMRNGNPM